MKNKLNVILFFGLALGTGCSQPNNSNKETSDTSSIYGQAEENANTDTVTSSAGDQITDSVRSGMGDNNSQAPRVSVGQDTTGKQPHDNKP